MNGAHPIEPPAIRLRCWTRGTDDDRRAGLLGYVSLEYGSLVLDGATVRRTAAGMLAVSFPSRSDGAGRRHPYFRPLDDAARRTIEGAILRQLGEREDFEP